MKINIKKDGDKGYFIGSEPCCENSKSLGCMSLASKHKDNPAMTWGFGLSDDNKQACISFKFYEMRNCFDLEKGHRAYMIKGFPFNYCPFCGTKVTIEQE